MHRLDRIQMAGFKSIRDQTLDLRALNVLIGANGAGKSNFIEVFRLLVLAELLHAAAERTPIIVSTQSVTPVNQLSPEDIVVVNREARESVFRRPSSTDLESWLDGFSLGDLWGEERARRPANVMKMVVIR